MKTVPITQEMLEQWRAADAHYEPLLPVSAFANCSVDAERWTRYGGELAAFASDRALMAQALEVVKRAAAIDTGAIEGLYQVDESFTLTVAKQSAMWQASLDSKGAKVRALCESQLSAYDHVLDLATRATPAFTSSGTRDITARMNELTPEANTALRIRMTDKLRKHCKARLRDYPTVEEWRPIFQRAAASAGLNGQNDRGWRADFEWFVKNADNVRKLLEGKYDGWGERQAAGGYKPRVVTSEDFEPKTTWDAIVDDVVMSLESPSERIYFDGVHVIAESPHQLVVAAPFVKRLTGEYAERIAASAAKVRPGLVVNVQAGTM